MSFKIIPCIEEVNAPSTGVNGPLSVASSISINPVGMILTSKTSPSTSTAYSVGMLTPSLVISACLGDNNSSSSTSPFKNLVASAGNNASVRISSSFLIKPSFSPCFLNSSYSGLSKSAGLQSIGFSSPMIFLANLLLTGAGGLP